MAGNKLFKVDVISKGKLLRCMQDRMIHKVVMKLSWKELKRNFRNTGISCFLKFTLYPFVFMKGLH